jgi:hypothetical protein
MPVESIMASRKNTVPIITALSSLVRSLIRDIAGVYRPERYYMRGPGPKWQEKHAAAPAPASDSVAAPPLGSKAAA